MDNHYSDTLIQIWHYYVMTQNMDESDKTQLFQTYIRDIEFTDSNPIIISHFINRGEKKIKTYGDIFVMVIKIRRRKRIGKVKFYFRNGGFLFLR